MGYDEAMPSCIAPVSQLFGRKRSVEDGLGQTEPSVDGKLRWGTFRRGIGGPPNLMPM